MYLRKGLLQLVISSTPVSSTSPAVQTASSLLIATDNPSVPLSLSSHDHCQSTSFTGSNPPGGSDSLRMCSSFDAPAIKTTTASSNPLSFPLSSSSGCSSRNNNGSCYFLQNSVHRHRQGFQNQLYQHGAGSHSSIRNLSSKCNDAPPEYLVRVNLFNKMRWLISRPYSSSSSTGPAGSGGGDDGGDSSKNLVVTIKDGLDTRESANDFLNQLTDHQKQLIYHTLNIQILKDKYEDRMGGPSQQDSHFYLSKFGRPACAKEDPTGTLCEVSDKWLHDRLEEKAPPAPASAIWAVAVKNALPFIGFGFLDNLIMILAGDYIDITIGTGLGISTMAAAALGNTISDVAGVGSAWYVEGLASKVGIKDPDLSPRQMATSAVRWASNLGRAFGVTIGCLLGMFPLLFLPTAEEKVKDKEMAMAAKEKKDKEEDKGKFA